MNYPNFVKQFRPKGTVIKKVNNVYYAYFATSKREPGKKYPVQVITGLAGKIDEKGFHELSKAMVDTEQIIIRECGFTNYLLKFEDGYIAKRNGTKLKVSDARRLYRSLIVYLSNNSYLNDTEKNLMTIGEAAETYSIGIPNQITAISKLIESDLINLEPLKYICSVQLGKRRFESSLTKAQEDLLKMLGLEEKDVRRQGKN